MRRSTEVEEETVKTNKGSLVKGTNHNFWQRKQKKTQTELNRFVKRNCVTKTKVQLTILLEPFWRSNLQEPWILWIRPLQSEGDIMAE